jgi:PAS domain-containing protein
MGDRGERTGDSRPDAEAVMAGCCAAPFEQMQEAVALHELVSDANGKPVDYRILDVNPQYERDTGLRRSDVAGQLASRVYGTGAAPFLDEFASVARGAASLRLETYFPPFGRHVSISAVRVGAADFAAIFSDVTSPTPLRPSATRAVSSRCPPG